METQKKPKPPSNTIPSVKNTTENKSNTPKAKDIKLKTKFIQNTPIVIPRPLPEVGVDEIVNCYNSGQYDDSAQDYKEYIVKLNIDFEKQLHRVRKNKKAFLGLKIILAVFLLLTVLFIVSKLCNLF
ncbi:hypothetical protein SLOPH_530 [Spraguea lophii 42_110]|uniref:Uncharacterized protein n=1 Tax=Spraguea lophii (strain 42_110) TaxID=1358809 RepID=S7WDL1_SPRLO|nr:hypothetical protein SLOPH_530 [Spraguea lophii 42_110]